MIKEKYKKLKDKTIKAPFVIESKISSLKTKQLIEILKKIFDDLYSVAISKRKIRAGKGKTRGRRYEKNAGVLLVIGKNEKLKTNAVEVKKADKLGVLDLAEGGAGRLTIYTENAIKNLGGKFEK